MPSSFTRFDPKLATRGLYLATWGEEKTGKTRFALGFPEPIYLLNIDFGFREVAAREFADKEIYHADIVVENPDDHGEAIDRLKEFKVAYSEALNNAGTGTIIVDTASQLWQLVQHVFVQSRVKKHIKKEAEKKRISVDQVDPDLITVFPFEYGEANMHMSTLLRRGLHAAERKGTNIVMIHRSREQYIDGKATGASEVHCFKETPAIAPVFLKHTKVQKNPKTMPEFYVAVERCRYDVSQEGFVLKLGDNPTENYELVKAATGLEID